MTARKTTPKTEDIVDAEVVKDDETTSEQDHLAALGGRWRALAAPFPTDQVELLPQNVKKYSKDEPRFNCIEGHRDFSKASKDGIACGGWHQWSIHLRYIGHAGITMRLNEVDPTWEWEPVAVTEAGTPMFTDGGMWIRLTVLGVTRLGFGDPGKNGLNSPNGVKELIGDALRNAAMRFGVGTYLWSKSDKAAKLQAGEIPEEQPPALPAQEQASPQQQQPQAAQQQPEPQQAPQPQAQPPASEPWTEQNEAGFQTSFGQNWNNAKALNAMGNWYSQNPNVPPGHLQKIRARIDQLTAEANTTPINEGNHA